MLDKIFQTVAKTFASTSERIKLNQIIQYRILIAIRILIGSSVPLLIMVVLTDLPAFGLESDPITILALGSLAAGLFYFVGKQLQFVYGNRTKIQDVIQQKFIAEVPAKKYLRTRIGHMCEWLIISFIFTTAFWLGCDELHLLYLVIGIPAFVDTIMVIIIVSWEYHQLTSKDAEGLPKSLPQ